MAVADDFRRILEECDVEGARKIWHELRPDLPQPKDDFDTLSTIHAARTAAKFMHFRKRAYSHRWLLDHGVPSLMPDRLKPSAEQIYPAVVEAVGISVNASSQLFKPIVKPVRDAMENAVLECYADKQKDPTFVKRRMLEARARTIKSLLGI